MQAVKYFFIFVAGYLVASIICILLMVMIDKDAYKQGQIDAINGEIKYELQLQEDGSTAWKESQK